MKIKTLKEREKEHIEEILHRTGWDLEKASRILQIPLSTVKKKIREYGMNREEDRE